MRYFAVRGLKLLHELGAIGVVGAFVAALILGFSAPAASPVDFAATQRNIHDLCRWLLMPSLGLVIASGLLSMAIVESYKSAGWAWIKALLGISVFEGTLLTVVAPARDAAALSALAVTGQGDPERLAELLRTERGGLWVLLCVALANLVLAIWRPRFGRG